MNRRVNITELFNIMELEVPDFMKRNSQLTYEVKSTKLKEFKVELKGQKRKLVKKYHPDTVTHLGEEYVKIANEVLSKINGAVDVLSKLSIRRSFNERIYTRHLNVKDLFNLSKREAEIIERNLRILRGGGCASFVRQESTAATVKFTCTSDTPDIPEGLGPDALFKKVFNK